MYLETPLNELEKDFDNDLVLQTVQHKIESVQQDVQAPASYKDFIYKFDFFAEIPPYKPMITFNDTPFLSELGISAIIAPEGTAKSYAIEMIIESYLTNQANGFEFKQDVQHLYYFDGERPKPIFQDRLKKCLIRSGINSNPINATLFDLSAIEPSNRLEYILNFDYIENSIIIIDGIGDLAYEVNNELTANKIVSDLSTMLKRINSALVTTLHVNPKSDKARGHLGSELQRRANVVLYMNRIDTDVIEVKTKKSNFPHTSTLISWCNDKHCFVHAPNLELGAVTYDKIRTIFEKLASEKNIEISEIEISSGELAKIFEKEFDVKERRANDYLKECKSKGIIYQTANYKQAPYRLKLDFGSAF